MSKKHSTKAKAPATSSAPVANISRLNWQGLRDAGFALIGEASDNKNLGSQSLAAAIHALLGEREITFEVGDARVSGGLNMLANYWQFSARNASYDKATMTAFRQAVFAEILPPKPEPDSKNGVQVKSQDFVQRLTTWNDHRQALSSPFMLAAALASREYDAGNFVVGHGYNIDRIHIVPEGFTLDTGNKLKPQSDDDVICLDYSSPLAKAKGKVRSDQVTIVRDDKGGFASIPHSVDSFIRAQRPARDNNMVKGLNLVKAVEYIAKQAKAKDTPTLAGEALANAQTAIAFLSRVVAHSNAAKDKPGLVDVNETDGKGNQKVA